MREFFNKIKEQKKTLNCFKDDVNLFFKELKDLNYKSLDYRVQNVEGDEFIKPTGEMLKSVDGCYLNYYIALPENLQAKFDSFNKRLIELDSQNLKGRAIYKIVLNGTIKKIDKECIEDLMEDRENDFDDDENELFEDEIIWSVSVDTCDFNRPHIPNNFDVPYSFRGLGLATKVYKKILTDIKFLSFNIKRSNLLGQFLWDSLISDEEIEVHYLQSRVIIWFKSDPPANLDDLLTRASRTNYEF